MDKEISNTTNISKLYLYILYFFIFSVCGWILETLFSFIVLGHFTNRGFLYGPLCPIYGWGAIILIVFLSNYKDSDIKLFIYSAVIFSVFEYFVSYLLEALFKEHWWDYTADFLNLNGRISIFYSLAWGFIAIIFIGHVYPFVEKKVSLLVKRINYNVLTIGINFTCFAFIFDTIISCIRYLNIMI